MRTIMFAFAGVAAISTAGAAHAADKVTLQLKWVTQAQFAGYYVAKDKGFYKEAGLDVTIKPGGPTSRPSRCSRAAAPMSSSTGCPPPSPRARRAR